MHVFLCCFACDSFISLCDFYIPYDLLTVTCDLFHMTHVFSCFFLHMINLFSHNFYTIHFFAEVIFLHDSFIFTYDFLMLHLFSCFSSQFIYFSLSNDFKWSFFIHNSVYFHVFFHTINAFSCFFHDSFIYLFSFFSRCTHIFMIKHVFICFSHAITYQS